MTSSIRFTCLDHKELLSLSSLSPACRPGRALPQLPNSNFAMSARTHPLNHSSRDAQIGRTPVNPWVVQQIHGKQVFQEEHKERKAAECGGEDEELQEENESTSHEGVETRKEQEEVSPVYTHLQPENPFLHLHSQVDIQNHSSAGHFPRDPEVFSSPSMSAMPSNADLLACMDSTGPFGGFPSKQVEGALQSCLTSAEAQVTRLLQQAMDTVQSQVLRALHQAASDIIQHLGKEAAHRVVVAERKAALLELELSSVKQQALSMLLRLKADSDAQALDADKKYLLERRRAQDAEAKLAIAQDSSKRLKAELKKKGDIIDKMQKLVQPVNEDNSRHPSRSMELTGHLESYVRGSNTDRLRKSPGCSVDKTSFNMCSTGVDHEEANCAENQPHMESTVQAGDDFTGKANSLFSETPTDEKLMLDLQTQSRSSNGTIRNNQCPPNLHVNDQVEHSAQMEDSNIVDSLHANVEQDAKRLEEADNILHHSHSDSIDEKVDPPLSGFENSVDGNDGISGPSAAVKGFYVRRKVRDNVKPQEKKVQSIAHIEHGLNAVSEDDLKAEVLLRPLNKTISRSKSDLSECELQHHSSKGDAQVPLDGTDSSSLLGHAVQLVDGCHGDLANDLQEEISGSVNGKAVDAGFIRTNRDVPTEIVEFARPDYEVATSLAELASIGLEEKGQKLESLSHIRSKEGTFLKPGRTGLRMKRKGISFDRKIKVQPQSEGRVIKKPRPDKLLSSLKDSHADRVLRRNRGRKYKILKDSLSLESSRDNRRLMQGARQLLCLAEKKWR